MERPRFQTMNMQMRKKLSLSRLVPVAINLLGVGIVIARAARKRQRARHLGDMRQRLARYADLESAREQDELKKLDEGWNLPTYVRSTDRGSASLGH
jgi:hypothetical protein